MSNLISVNIQECNPATSICHNSIDRTNISYLITDPNTISNYRHELANFNEDLETSKNEIYDYFKLRQQEIKSDYKISNNQSMQKTTKLYHEAVISFGREQFENCAQSDILKSINNFSNNFENKYNVKVLMTSLHLDEGHITKDADIKHNYHAHVLIENYSFDTHKTGMRQIDYRKLQTDLAKEFEHLGFQRGKDYTALQKTENELARTENRTPKILRPVRLEHMQYREMKEQTVESKIELTAENKNSMIFLKNRVNYLELERNNAILDLVDSGLIARQDAEHNTLDTIIKRSLSNQSSFNEVIEKRLNEENQALKNEFQEQLSLAKTQYDKERIELKTSGIAKQSDYQELKKMFEAQKVEIIAKNRKLDLLELRNSTLETSLNLKNSSIERIKCELNEEKSAHLVTKIKVENLVKENTNLKTAVEQFLDALPMERIAKVGKSLLERLNDSLNGIKKHFDQFKTEKIKLITELDELRISSNSKIDISIAENSKSDPRELKTTEEVLTFFKKLKPDEMKFLVVEGTTPPHSSYGKQFLIDGKAFTYLEKSKVVTELIKKLNLEELIPKKQPVKKLSRDTDMDFSL